MRRYREPFHVMAIRRSLVRHPWWNSTVTDVFSVPIYLGKSVRADNGERIWDFKVLCGDGIERMVVGQVVSRGEEVTRRIKDCHVEFILTCNKCGKKTFHREAVEHASGAGFLKCVQCGNPCHVELQCTFEVLQDRVPCKMVTGIALVDLGADQDIVTDLIGNFEFLEEAEHAFVLARDSAKINVTRISVVAHPLGIRWHRMLDLANRCAVSVRECSRDVKQYFPGTGKDPQIFSPPNPWREHERENWELSLREEIAFNEKTWMSYPTGHYFTQPY